MGATVELLWRHCGATVELQWWTVDGLERENRRLFLRQELKQNLGAVEDTEVYYFYPDEPF